MLLIFMFFIIFFIFLSVQFIFNFFQGINWTPLTELNKVM